MISEEKRRSFAHGVNSKLDAEKEITPQGLSDLIGLSYKFNPLALTLSTCLTKQLLKRTINHAVVNTKYYGDRKSEYMWQEVDDLAEADISSLPTLCRSDITQNHDAFQASDVKFRSLCHTSGTTGEPLEIHKSWEETRFITDYFSRLYDPLYEDTPSLPLSLSFPNNYHGTPTPMPTFGKGLIGGVTDDTLITDALRVLKKDYNIAGHDANISRLSGLAFHVLFFTNYLQEQGIDPKDFNLRNVGIAGNYIAPHWRRYLADAWGCPINDRYSLTECLGGASRIGDTNMFKMDPILYAEVLDPDTGSKLKSGIGQIALTNLHPFV